MQKNKTSTYLLYAFGEIVLVVLGILIAVSLNDTNQARKDNLRSMAYLERLDEDLEIMKLDIQSSIEHNMGLLNGAIMTKEMLESGALEAEQKEIIDHYLARLHQYTLTIQDSKSYREMLSSGELSLIKNRWIRDQMQEVADHREFLLEVGRSFHKQALSEYQFITAFVKYNVIHPGTDSSQVLPIYNIQEMSKDNNLINMISKQSSLWNDMLYIHKRHLNKVTLLKDSVEKHLFITP